MTNNKCQTKIKMREALRQLKQSKFFYMEYMNSSDEDKQFLEYVVDTILTKGCQHECKLKSKFYKSDLDMGF